MEAPPGDLNDPCSGSLLTSSQRVLNLLQKSSAEGSLGTNDGLHLASLPVEVYKKVEHFSLVDSRVKDSANLSHENCSASSLGIFHLTAEDSSVQENTELGNTLLGDDKESQEKAEQHISPLMDSHVNGFENLLHEYSSASCLGDSHLAAEGSSVQEKTELGYALLGNDEESQEQHISPLADSHVNGFENLFHEYCSASSLGGSHLAAEVNSGKEKTELRITLLSDDKEGQEKAEQHSPLADSHVNDFENLLHEYCSASSLGGSHLAAEGSSDKEKAELGNNLFSDDKEGPEQHSSLVDSHVEKLSHECSSTSFPRGSCLSFRPVEGSSFQEKGKHSFLDSQANLSCNKVMNSLLGSTSPSEEDMEGQEKAERHSCGSYANSPGNTAVNDGPSSSVKGTSSNQVKKEQLSFLRNQMGSHKNAHGALRNSPTETMYTIYAETDSEQMVQEYIESFLPYATTEVKDATIEIYKKYLGAVDQSLKSVTTVLFYAIGMNASLKQHNNDVKQLIHNKESKEKRLECFIEKCISMNEIQPLHNVLDMLQCDSDDLLQDLKELMFEKNLVGETASSSVDSDDDLSVESSSSFESSITEDWLLKPHEASDSNRKKIKHESCLEPVSKPFITENPYNYDQNDSL